MKKILFVLAIGAFAACNDSGSSSDKKDSTNSTMAPAPDSTKKMNDSTSKMSPDTTKKDTTMKK